MGKNKNDKTGAAAQGAVKPRVFNVRGRQVVLDRELAAYIGLPTGRLNEPYRRNKHLFSEEMIFQLTSEEFGSLKTQIAFSNESTRGGSRHLPFVYTEEGVKMLEKVLKRSIGVEFQDPEALLAEIIENGVTDMPDILKDRVYVIRGERVMLDIDLANIYGYTTKAFNQQVKNNLERFDSDFMFQLTKEEYDWCSRSKNLTLNVGRGSNMKYLPYAFTEQGVYMLMAVLKGELAVEQSKELVRAFKRMKNFVLSNPCLTSGCQMKIYVEQQGKEITELKEKINDMGSNMVSQSDIKDVMQWFRDANQGKEILLHQRAFQEANYAYISIYAEAHKTIYIVDNYIGVKTIELLCAGARNGVSVTIFSENAGKQLTKAEVESTLEGRTNLDIRFKHNGGVYHDRYIVLDYGSDTEKIYDCGCSSKDAGKSITSITQKEYTRPYHQLVDELLCMQELVLH